jgi:sugar diacid utilization regulator
VARAASACAIELDRERAVVETRDQLEGEFIASLLGGTYSSEDVIGERAKRLGVDLEQRFLVIALRGSKPAAESVWQNDALRATRKVVTHREQPGFVAAHEGAVCVVIAYDEATAEVAFARLAETMRNQCAVVTGDQGVSLGIGRPSYGPAGVRVSYREAEHALALGRRILGPGKSVSFANLGLHRLLFAVAQHSELFDFYRDAVGEVVAYDERSGAELMSTLEAFFASNGSPTETAQRLHLHRNTVLYRLRRIEEVGRLRLEDPGTRLNLHLCLRIRDVLQAAPARA